MPPPPPRHAEAGPGAKAWPRPAATSITPPSAVSAHTLIELRNAVQKHRRDSITRTADFTLRGYWYLMRSEENWAKLAWNADREYFIDPREEVAEIRNDLMHFTTDDVDPAQYDAVEGFLEMLRTADPRQ